LIVRVTSSLVSGVLSEREILKESKSPLDELEEEPPTSNILLESTSSSSSVTVIL
jgi:hypothetical protein